jgi:beta-lactamase regulating signal transducer with metallopeptidase domain
MIATSDLMQTLAWSLLHFLWQGAAIAAVAAAVMYVLRSPSARYLVGISALVLMLASFAITFSLISGAPNAAESLGVTGTPAAAASSTLEAAAIYSGESAPTISSADSVAWIARGWLAGVFLFALRIAFGLMVLEQLRRRNLVALPEALLVRFRILQHRLGIRRAIGYFECHQLRVPAVIGFLRPVVLLPVRALTGLSVEQLEAVVAHELGHIKRFDVAVNFFQVIAESLFFFHPAVWWLNRRIRADREDCCDDVAIAASGSTAGYARALATMEDWRDVPSFAMAATGSPVAARVARLLGVRQDSTSTRAAGVVTATVVLATALVAGAVSIGVVNPALAQAPVPTDTVSEVTEVELAAVAQIETEAVVEETVEAHAEAVVEAATAASPVIAPAPVAPPAASPAKAAKEPQQPKPPRAPKPAPVSPQSPQSPQSSRSPSSPTSSPSAPSFIQEMNSVGLTNLDVDTLVALRVHGVSPAFVRDIRSTGLNPDTDALLAMKIHGVSPAFVKEVRDMGFNPESDELIAMKVHGITPDYVKAMRTAGFNPDSDQLIAMKVHDVTPEFRKSLEGAGMKLDVDELIQAKVMDITPQFIARVNSHGFKNLTLDKLIALKNADIL